jgi:hypothetical protein
MTYAQIPAECARIVATSDRVLPPHAGAVAAAFMQHTSGPQVIERCSYCRGLLAVAEKGSAWVASGPCDRSHDTFRGL